MSRSLAGAKGINYLAGVSFFRAVGTTARKVVKIEYE